MKKIRMTCRVCEKRCNFHPKLRTLKVRGRFIKEIFFKCPRCLHEGWFRYKRHGAKK